MSINSNINYFPILPREIIQHIFSFMDLPNDQPVISSTCKCFNQEIKTVKSLVLNDLAIFHKFVNGAQSINLAFPNLEEVSLTDRVTATYGSKASWPDIDQLLKISTLKKLFVDDFSNANRGFEEKPNRCLEKNTSLEKLVFSNSVVEPDHLKSFLKQTALKELNLENVMAHIQVGEFSDVDGNVEQVILGEDAFDDEALEYIFDDHAIAPDLKVLNISDSCCTKEGIAQLQEQRPGLKVILDGVVYLAAKRQKSE